ncbi:MAG: nucleotide exchange factor GrpE [Candidatus Bathyarchaeia archaeon]
MKKKQKITDKKRRVTMENAQKEEDLVEKLEAEQKKNKEYLNRLKYLQADFENYRKRIEKELQEAIQRSNEKIITCLIDIMDDLESAISAGKTTENKNAVLEGIKMIHKKLHNLLEKEGLMRLETVGKPFDPNLHEILAEIPTQNHQHGIVVEEARKGYMFKGKVLRPSIVKIACEDSGDKER